jgi:hypothetical protein
MLWEKLSCLNFLNSKVKLPKWIKNGSLEVKNFFGMKQSKEKALIWKD